MKFDYCIGNPPYQESRTDTRDVPLFHDFMDAAYTVADKVELITPAKWLFNAGATPKTWNEKMLNDEHLKVLMYEPDAKNVFPTTGFKGGVTITYRNANESYGAIESYSAFDELNSIRYKMSVLKYDSFADIIYGQGSYKFTDLMHQDHPEIKFKDDGNGGNLGLLSKGHDKDIATNALDKLNDIIMFENKPHDSYDYIQIFGRKGNERAKSYIRRDYVCPHPNLDFYKVFLPKANGSGSLGEVLTTPLVGEPLVGEPLVGVTQTFLAIGKFDLQSEAENCMKYIKTKFARVLLGILKVTQDNPPEKWRYVPLQDFTSNSDIDWSQSIADIDKQLYKKYGLSQEEINFIETHVKEMV